jgi:hypothetical protein
MKKAIVVLTIVCFLFSVNVVFAQSILEIFKLVYTGARVAGDVLDILTEKENQNGGNSLVELAKKDAIQWMKGQKIPLVFKDVLDAIIFNQQCAAVLFNSEINSKKAVVALIFQKTGKQTYNYYPVFFDDMNDYRAYLAQYGSARNMLYNVITSELKQNLGPLNPDPQPVSLEEPTNTN